MKEIVPAIVHLDYAHAASRRCDSRMARTVTIATASVIGLLVFLFGAYKLATDRLTHDSGRLFFATIAGGVIVMAGSIILAGMILPRE